jgi:hypothetical protein
MGLARSDVFDEMYNEIKGFVPTENRKWIANIIYDKATDMDVDDWDGSTDLEIEGNINQED